MASNAFLTTLPSQGMTHRSTVKFSPELSPVCPLFSRLRLLTRQQIVFDSRYFSKEVSASGSSPFLCFYGPQMSFLVSMFARQCFFLRPSSSSPWLTQFFPLGATDCSYWIQLPPGSPLRSIVLANTSSAFGHGASLPPFPLIFFFVFRMADLGASPSL